jgi:plasmid stabilization system protein ParE
LGARYLAEVEGALVRVSESPQQYAVERPAGLRRAVLHQFPFTLIFREVGGTVQVLAVAHHRRRPGYWGTRL